MPEHTPEDLQVHPPDTTGHPDPVELAAAVAHLRGALRPFEVAAQEVVDDPSVEPSERLAASNMLLKLWDLRGALETCDVLAGRWQVYR